jgi:hypothetical protein
LFDEHFDEHYLDVDEHYFDEHFDYDSHNLNVDVDYDSHDLDVNEHNLHVNEHNLHDAYVHTDGQQHPLHRRHSVLQQYLQYIRSNSKRRQMRYVPLEWQLLLRRRL